MDPRVEVARLAAAVMVADGRLERRELEASSVLDVLGLGGLTPFVREELEHLRERPIDVDEACHQLGGMHPQAAATLIGALAQVAVADGAVADEEMRMLDAIGRRLGLGSDEIRAVVESAARGHPAWERPAESAAPDDADRPASSAAHRLLGVPPDADADAVDAAYLALVARYDPAKVAELGPEFAALAARKLFEATLAYETVTGRSRP